MLKNGSLYLNSSFFRCDCRAISARRTGLAILLGMLVQGGLFASTVAVKLSSTTASLYPSATYKLTATVTGSAQTGVNWSLNGGVGSLATSGTSAVYTAPAVIFGSPTVSVTATSIADPTKSATAALKLLSQVSVAVSPTSYSLEPGNTEQFKATVAGSSNPAVTWSISPQLGTIDNTGLYTAPASLPAPNAQTVTVTATSVAAPTATASAKVTVHSGVQFTMGPQALTALTYNGAAFLYTPKASPVVSEMTAMDPSGNVSHGALVPTSVVTDPVANTVTNTYSWGVMTTAYTAVSNKLQIAVSIRNTSSTNTITHLRLFPIGVAFPSNPTNNPSTNVQFNTDTPSSIFFPYSSGAIALVNDDVSLPLGTGFWACQSPAAADWQVMLNMDINHTLANWPTVPRPIAPNASDKYYVSLRWGAAGATQLQLTGDVFTEYANAFPDLVAPLNKPLAALTLSTRSRGPASVKNPRGWFSGDVKVDVTTPQGVANFQSMLLTYADTAITEMLRVGAAGGILWDIEGQQTDESYVGDPSQAETLAPELLGVLDAFVNKFKAAGLRIGFTVRSQVFTHNTGFANVSGNVMTWAGGTQFNPAWLPGLHSSGAMLIGSNNYQIKSVNSPTQITLTTSVAPYDAGAGVPFAYNSHTAAQDPGAELMNKVAYVQNRWGGDLFYVDSDVTHDGIIDPAIGYMNVVNAYPGVLLFPEWKLTRHYAYSYPYNDPINNTWGPPAQTLLTYPQSGALIRVNDQIAAAPGNQAKLVGLVQAGNILMIDGWYRHSGNDVVQQVYQQAF